MSKELGQNTMIKKNYEKVRKKWVVHEGKRKLVVFIDDFVFGKKNPWERTVSLFSKAIDQNLAADVLLLLPCLVTARHQIYSMSIEREIDNTICHDHQMHQSAELCRQGHHQTSPCQTRDQIVRLHAEVARLLQLSPAEQLVGTMNQ